MRHLLAALLMALMTLAAPVGSREALAQGATFVRGGTAVYPGLDVNIDDGTRTARLHIAFEAQCVSEAAAQMAAGPEAREAVLFYLRNKTVAELTEPLGQRKLKRELVAVMNKAVGGPRVVRIYLVQLLIG